MATRWCSTAANTGLWDKPAENVGPNRQRFRAHSGIGGAPDIHLLLDQVLPDTPEAYSEALSFLADAQDPTTALEVWHRLIAKDPMAGLKWGIKLTDMLVAQEKF